MCSQAMERTARKYYAKYFIMHNITSKSYHQENKETNFASMIETHLVLILIFLI
jgi:hypothetical protein